LEYYYAEKNTITRIRQRSVDLRKIVTTAIERNVKKYDLQVKQLQDTDKRETYRVYGELLNAYGYGVEAGAKSMEALNYYTDEKITIPLDPMLTAGENAKKYFDKYQKLKRTYEALTTLTKETKEEIEHLSSISIALDIALKEEDLVQIKEELIESGYIRRKGNTKREKITSKPFHYVSSDGYHIYVGKNNYQNEELTFKFATGNDWWFHTKGIPGSHVVVKSNNDELPDRVFEEAGKLAAHYSQARGQEKVEIDYTQKKNVKKPNGSKPGFVVYYTNYSLVIDSDITGITQIE
jgi:predicted ribosome quality control (RQC) complex YloA/Tae2 family protein